MAVLEDRFEPLFQAPPFAIVPRNDPLAAEPSVTLAQLVEKPIIMLDLPGARDYFAGTFSAVGLTPRIAHSTRSSEILRALVGSGFGVSILNIRPLGYVKNESDFIILPIRDAIEPPTFGIVTSGNTELPGLVKSFIDYCIFLKNNGEFSGLTIS